MTSDEALAIARNQLSRLAVNPLCSRDHAEKLVREDALVILRELECNLDVEYQPDYLKPVEDYEYDEK